MLPDRSVLIGQKLVENATFLVIFKQCAMFLAKRALKSPTKLDLLIFFRYYLTNKKIQDDYSSRKKDVFLVLPR